MRVIAMCYGYARECRNSNSAGHTGHNLKGDSGLRECLRFFGAPAKNEWIATLQPAHIHALASLLNHEPMNVFLLKVLLADFLANIDDFGRRLRLLEQVQVNQAVMKHNVGRAQACETAHSNKVRIA